jgi:hypothetical protein
LLRQGEKEEDSETVLHVFDARRKNDISTGIRVFQRNALKELDALVSSRKEELKEFNVGELGSLQLACGATGRVLTYSKQIKTNTYDMLEVCFVFNDSGYIAQIYSEVDLTDEFRADGLKSIKSIDFTVQAPKKDMMLYENREDGFEVAVPADLLSITEQPMVPELLVEFMHTMDKDSEFHTVILKGKKQPTITNVRDLRESTLAEMEAQSKQLRSRINMDLFTVKKDEIKVVNGMDAFVLVLSTLHHMTGEPVVNTSTYIIKGDQVFTVQSQITESAYTQAVKEWQP